MKRGKVKKKASFITILIASTFLFLMWVGRVIYINMTEPDTVYRYYEVGEMCEYKGIGISVTNFEILSLDEFGEKYENTEQYLQAKKKFGYEYVVCVVHYMYTRIGEGEGPMIYDDKLVTPALTGINDMYSLDESGFSYYENFQNVIEELEIGESVDLWRIYPFSIAEEKDKDYYYNLDKYPLYIQYLDYEGSEYIRMLKVNDVPDF